DAENYVLTQPIGLSADITPATLTVRGATAVDRDYNRTTEVAIIGGELEGVFNSDIVDLEQSNVGQLQDKNAGIDKPVTTRMAISGADAGNYRLTQPAGLTADIAPLALTVVANDDNKIFDEENFYLGGNGVTFAG